MGCVVCRTCKFLGLDYTVYILPQVIFNEIITSMKPKWDYRLLIHLFVFYVKLFGTMDKSIDTELSHFGSIEEIMSLLIKNNLDLSGTYCQDQL